MPPAHGASSQVGNVIGRELFVKGEISGAESLAVEGRVEGHINIKGHLFVAQEAAVLADVQADTVSILGEVQGNVTASTRIEIHETARVSGDLRAPQVYLADGAQLRGAIEMEVVLPREF